MAVREGDVLKPLAPAIRDDIEQWPEFSLRHTRVLSQKTGEIVSLLAANEDHLVRVEGHLEEVDEDERNLVRLPNYRYKMIAVEDVATYSFSQFDDGTFGFWAGGKAGWFEVTRPVKSFQKVYEEMNEATHMFYFLADKCKNSRRSFSRATAKDIDHHVKHLFNAYSTCPGCRRRDVTKAQQGFYHHRMFLIKSMLEGQEGLEWDTFSFFHHIKRIYPVEFAAARVIVGKSQAADSDDNLKLAEDVRKAAKPDQSSRAYTVKSLKKACKKDIVQTSVRFERELSGRRGQDEARERLPIINPRKRKSNLRPRSNEYAKKSTGRLQSLRASEEEQGNEDDEAQGAQIRMEGSIPNRKRSDYADVFLPPPTALPLKAQKKTPQKMEKEAHVKVANNPLPSYYEPRGPGDTWICPYDGCNKRVYQAKETYAVEMIKDHFVKTHANNAEDLINQESRPWTSAEHLLERIKCIASLQAQAVPQEPEFPARIFRRY